LHFTLGEVLRELAADLRAGESSVGFVVADFLRHEVAEEQADGVTLRAWLGAASPWSLSACSHSESLLGGSPSLQLVAPLFLGPAWPELIAQ